MKAKLLVTTAAVALMLSGGAYAQTRSIDTNSERPSATQSQSDRGSATKDMDRTNVRDSGRMDRSQTTGQAPAASTASDSKASSGSAADSESGNNSAASQDKAQQRSSTTPSDQNAKSNAAQDNKDPSSRSNQASEPRNSKSNSAADTNKNTNSASQSDKNQPAAAQRDQADDRQQRTTNSNADNSRDAAGGANAQAATRASASLQAEQKTRLNQAVTKLDAKPVTNVNFSISVGTAVPRSVSLRPVPRTIVSIVPQYSGYNYFLVRNQVVIVEPRSHKIVDVIERGGPSQAGTTTTRERRVNLSDKQRSYIREHASSRRTSTTTTTTTGAAPRSETIIVGEEVPQSIEIETFPEEVYREVPVVREYRYVRSGSGVYLVDPGSRRVIEEIE